MCPRSLEWKGMLPWIGPYCLLILMPHIAVTYAAQIGVPPANPGHANVPETGQSRRAMRGVETSYEKAVAIDGPLRLARGTFWNGKSGGSPLSDRSTPGPLAYPATHKHDVPFDGLLGSTAVVVGRVKTEQSYLSSDKTTIYTEMEVTLESVLLNESELSLTEVSSISVGRAGGAVRLASGELLVHGCIEESMPRPGHSYLLALAYSRPGNMYPLRTGFELSGDHVYMLDSVQRGAVSRPGSQSAMRELSTLAEYGLPTSDFLDIARKSLAGSSH